MHSQARTISTEPGEFQRFCARHTACSANAVRIALSGVARRRASENRLANASGAASGSHWRALARGQSWVGWAIVCAWCAGCSGAPQALHPSSAWINQHGGTAVASEQRADRICRQLAAETFTQPIPIHVLAEDRLCGYAWPGGSIFITRGLMTAATDEEVAAAIAHEMGHLLARRSYPTVFALAGGSDSHDIEAQADAIGCFLLRVKGGCPSAMGRLLQKVKDSSLTPAPVRLSLAHRIELLRAIQ